MKIEPNAESGTVTVQIDGTFDQAQLRDLLRQLANARATIYKEPTALTPETMVDVASDGWGFHTIPTPDAHSLLLLRHPGYGWIGNKLPIPHATQLAGLLQQQGFAHLTAATGLLLQAMSQLAKERAAEDDGAPKMPEPEVPKGPVGGSGGDSGGQTVH